MTLMALDKWMTSHSKQLRLKYGKVIEFFTSALLIHLPTLFLYNVFDILKLKAKILFPENEKRVLVVLGYHACCQAVYS